MEEHIDNLKWLICLRAQMAKARRERELGSPCGQHIDPRDIGGEYPNRLEIVAIVENIENSKN